VQVWVAMTLIDGHAYDISRAISQTVGRVGSIVQLRFSNLNHVRREFKFVENQNCVSSAARPSLIKLRLGVVKKWERNVEPCQPKTAIGWSGTLPDQIIADQAGQV
jgi:hypothetical protein